MRAAILAFALLGVLSASEKENERNLQSAVSTELSEAMPKDSRHSDRTLSGGKPPTKGAKDTLYDMLVESPDAAGIVEGLAEERAQYAASVSKASLLETVRVLYEEGALSFDEAVVVLSTRRLNKDMAKASIERFGQSLDPADFVKTAWSRPSSSINKVPSDMAVTSGDRTLSSGSDMGIATKSLELDDLRRSNSSDVALLSRPPMPRSRHSGIQSASNTLSPLEMCFKAILRHYPDNLAMMAVAREHFVDSDDYTSAELVDALRSLRTLVVERRLASVQKFIPALRAAAEEQGKRDPKAAASGLDGLKKLASADARTVIPEDVAPAVTLAMRVSPAAFFPMLSLSTAIEARDSAVSHDNHLIVASLITTTLTDLQTL